MQRRTRLRFKGNLLGIIIGIIFMWALTVPQICYAEIASDSAFEGAVWELVHEDQIVSQAEGVVQSICSTDDYIVCIENTTDTSTAPDTVSVFYKNNVDAEGNPVEQYSLYKQLGDRNYEHANGLAYNPKTNEILVSLYTNIEGEENKGSLYIMDASTFEYKDKVQISTEYNILGVGYDEEKVEYVIQTNADDNYSFLILDANYQVVEDLGEYADTTEGDNFQDLCVDGDYIINFPLTLNMGIGDFIHMYSISRKAMVSASQLDFKFEGVTSDEPESIWEISPGVFLAAVNVTMEDGMKYLRLYRTSVPYNFAITTAVKNGTISEGSAVVQSGEDYKVTFEPEENYKLSSLTVDGEKLNIEDYSDSYTFEKVADSHAIEVVFEEMTFGERLSSLFSSGNKEAETLAEPTEEKAEKSHTGLIIFLVIACVLGGIAFYLRLLYVRRMRIIKKRRAERERRRVIHEYQNRELEEMEDLEMREYIEIK